MCTFSLDTLNKKRARENTLLVDEAVDEDIDDMVSTVSSFQSGWDFMYSRAILATSWWAFFLFLQTCKPLNVWPFTVTTPL